MSAVATAELIMLGIKIASAAAQGVTSAVEAKRQVEAWTAEGRDPTKAEVDALKAKTADLMAQIREA